MSAAESTLVAARIARRARLAAGAYAPAASDAAAYAPAASDNAIPVISLAPFVGAGGSQAARDSVAAQWDAACRNVGFVKVEDHGVPAGVISAAWRAAAALFALPLEEKVRRRRRLHGRRCRPRAPQPLLRRPRSLLTELDRRLLLAGLCRDDWRLPVRLSGHGHGKPAGKSILRDT